MNMLAGLRAHLPRLLPMPRLLPLVPPGLLAHLLPWLTTAPLRRHASCITRPHFDGELPSADAPADGSDADLHACTCGWFDSSHELRHGLLVREHAGDDHPGTELPLAQWLELHLHGWRGQSTPAA